MPAKTTCQLCFLFVLLAGIGCAAGGPLLDQAVKAALSDATLTPEELSEDNYRQRTQRMVDRATRHHLPFWIGLGGLLVAVGIVGLRATSMLTERPS